MKTYEIEFYGWIPSYGDFDHNWFEVKAESEEEALKKFFQRNKFVKHYSIKIKN